jgi:hypothetical protein
VPSDKSRAAILGHAAAIQCICTLKLVLKQVKVVPAAWASFSSLQTVTCCAKRSPLCSACKYKRSQQKLVTEPQIYLNALSLQVTAAYGMSLDDWRQLVQVDEVRQ